MFDDYEGSRLEFLKILVEQGEEPAFLRRSREVSESVARVRREISETRCRLLTTPLNQLVLLHSKIGGSWSRLEPLLADRSHSRIYPSLYSKWSEEIDLVLIPDLASWFSTSRSVLRRFHDSVDRFNERWERFLSSIDLSAVNQTLAQYNEYYPLEKACAFGTEDIERLGFHPTAPITRDELCAEYPIVDLPALR